MALLGEGAVWETDRLKSARLTLPLDGVLLLRGVLGGCGLTGICGSSLETVLEWECGSDLLPRGLPVTLHEEMGRAGGVLALVVFLSNFLISSSMNESLLCIMYPAL